LAKHAAKTKLFEIYGLEKKERGRACDLHQNGCGNHVEVGYVFCLNKVVVSINGTEEVAVEARINGTEEVAVEARLVGEKTCRIGFLPRMLLSQMEWYVGQEGLIEELKSRSVNGYVRKDSYRMGGIAKCRLIQTDN
jgi:hypothetical protein